MTELKIFFKLSFNQIWNPTGNKVKTVQGHIVQELSLQALVIIINKAVNYGTRWLIPVYYITGHVIIALLISNLCLR